MSEHSPADGVLFTGLVDDAGLFPPEELDMSAAIARHRRNHTFGSPVLSGRFICPAGRLDELRQNLDGGDRVRVSVTTELTSPALDSMLKVFDGKPRLSLVAVEGLLRSPGTICGDLARPPEEISVFLEIRPDGDFPAALDLVEERGWSAKVRCGGVRQDVFPSPDRLAAFVHECAARAIPFKATAGLHHAVRYVDAVTGFTHHGFLNLILAVKRAVAGEPAEALAEVLHSVDTDALVSEIRHIDQDLAARVRGTLISYGCCSTSEPVEDLRSLGLLSDQSS
jgi:hypothetical protein